MPIIEGCPSYWRAVEFARLDHVGLRLSRPSLRHSSLTSIIQLWLKGYSEGVLISKGCNGPGGVVGAANCCKLSRLSKMEVCYNITAVRLFGSSRLGKQFSSNFAVILVKMQYLDNQVAKL